MNSQYRRGHTYAIIENGGDASLGVQGGVFQIMGSVHADHYAQPFLFLNGVFSGACGRHRAKELCRSDGGRCLFDIFLYVCAACYQMAVPIC
jgi:hypothetical protein